MLHSNPRQTMPTFLFDVCLLLSLTEKIRHIFHREMNSASTNSVYVFRCTSFFVCMRIEGRGSFHKAVIFNKSYENSLPDVCVNVLSLISSQHDLHYQIIPHQFNAASKRPGRQTYSHAQPSHSSPGARVTRQEHHWKKHNTCR